ncbi:MAG: hypothetical protein O3A20_11545 [Planctomycetota bacterium]|nr:hypothetical protein [Planctomycetota bacterium]
MDEDRRRWSRLIMFTLVLVLGVMLVIWWASWFSAILAGPTGAGSN